MLIRQPGNHAERIRYKCYGTTRSLENQRLEKPQDGIAIKKTGGLEAAAEVIGAYLTGGSAHEITVGGGQGGHALMTADAGRQGTEVGAYHGQLRHGGKVPPGGVTGGQQAGHGCHHRGKERLLTVVLRHGKAGNRGGAHQGDNGGAVVTGGGGQDVGSLKKAARGRGGGTAGSVGSDGRLLPFPIG